MVQHRANTAAAVAALEARSFSCSMVYSINCPTGRLRHLRSSRIPLRRTHDPIAKTMLRDFIACSGQCRKTSQPDSASGAMMPRTKAMVFVVMALTALRMGVAP